MTPSAPLFYWSDVDVSFKYHVKYHSDSVADLFCRVTFYTRWRKSVLGHEWRSHSLNYQRCDLEAHWCIRNILRAKYLDVSVTLPLAVWNVFWLEKTSSTTYSQWKSRIQGKGNFGGRSRSFMWFSVSLLTHVFCKLFWNYIELLRFFPSEILCNVWPQSLICYVMCKPHQLNVTQNSCAVWKEQCSNDFENRGVYTRHKLTQ